MEKTAPNCTQTLPEGYREILSVDLQQDKKLAFLINGAAVAAMLVLSEVGHLIVPLSVLVDSSLGLGPYLLRFGVLLAGLAAYIVLHELTHAAVMKLFSRDRVRFGLQMGMAYAGSDTLFRRTHYLAVALAPVTLWGLVFLALNLLLPGDWFWPVYVLQLLNLSGAAGDLYVSWMFARRKDAFLVQDTGLEMTVFTPAKKAEGPAAGGEAR